MLNMLAQSATASCRISNHKRTAADQELHAATNVCNELSMESKFGLNLGDRVSSLQFAKAGVYKNDCL
jgi:hypothetical protein